MNEKKLINKLIQANLKLFCQKQKMKYRLLYWNEAWMNWFGFCPVFLSNLSLLWHECCFCIQSSVIHVSENVKNTSKIRLSFPANPLYELIHHLTRAVSQSSGSIEPISPQFKGHWTASSRLKHDWNTTILILHVLWSILPFKSLGIVSN